MYYINIPENIELKINKNCIYIKTFFCEKLKSKPSDLYLYKKDNKLYFLSPLNKNKLSYLSSLDNLLKSLTWGCFVKLKLVGVGFKIMKQNNMLFFKLGYSHEIIYNIPKNINIWLNNTRDPILLIHGFEWQQVKLVASQIRQLKKPDNYKGKGFSFFDEKLYLKEGKKTNL